MNPDNPKCPVAFLKTYKRLIPHKHINPRISIYLPLLWVVLFSLLFNLIFGQNDGIQTRQANDKQNSPLEEGNLFIRQYNPKEYGAHFQNWWSTQGRNGVMYFGNGYGVLEFDGKHWRLIKTSNNSLVRSLAVDRQGTLYVGAVDQFGTLSPGPDGQMKYVSISDPLVPAKEKPFYDVWSTCATNHGIYFKTRSKIFKYLDGKLEILPISSAPQAFIIKDEYLFYHDGIYVLKKNKPLLLPHSQRLKGAGFSFIMPYSGSELLIATEQKGFFIYDLSQCLDKQGRFKPDFDNALFSPQTLRPFPTEIDAYLLSNKLYSYETLPPDRFAFATLLGGIIIMDRNGKLVRVIDKKQGLHRDFVTYLYRDSQQNLWATLNYGIAYIELNDGVSQFNGLNGLEEIVTCITRHKSRLYVGTFAGLYYLHRDPSDPVKNGYRYRFLPVNNIKMSCWDFVSTGDALWVGGNDGIKRADEISDQPPDFKDSMYCFGQSPKFPHHIFVGTISGIRVLEIKKINKAGGGKKTTLIPLDKNPFEKITGSIRKITADPKGDLWITTQYNGLIYLKFSGPGMTDFNLYIYGTDHGLPRMDWNVAYFFNNQIIVSTEKGIYKANVRPNSRFDPVNVRFTPENSIIPGPELSTTHSSVTFYAEKEDAWLFTREALGRLTRNRNGTYSCDTVSFRKIKEEVLGVWKEDNGITWICTNNGLFRYDPAVKKKVNINYQVLIRGVNLPDGSLLPLSPPAPPHIPYRTNSVSFHYAAPYYEQAEFTRFQYRLEGFDRDWSPWSSSSNTVYTNLPEGKYCFKVSAHNIYHHKTPPAGYYFIVSPPWSRTVYAYIGYGIGLLALLLSAYLVHRKKLRDAVLQERRKYMKCQVNPEKIDEYRNRLLQFMETQKPYLDPNLSLASLSKTTGIQRHFISQILNLQLKLTFWDFISEYRITEAQKILSGPANKELNLMNIALQVGFNSTVPFNKYFKKFIGMTPSRYRKKKCKTN